MTVDPLTGLPNREALPTSLPSGGTVLFVDLDGLKAVNDTQGHAAGDEYIRRAAHALCAAIRANDLVLRWGGDEFVVVCPGTDPSAVARAVGAVFRASGVAATVGCAAVLPGEPLAAAVARADSDMYHQRERRVDRRGLTASVADVVLGGLGGDGWEVARPADLVPVQHLVRRRILRGVVPLTLRRAWYVAYPAGLRLLRRSGDIAGVLHHTPLRPDVVDDLAARRIAERDIGAGDIDPASSCTHVQVLAAATVRDAAMLLLHAMPLLQSYQRITALATPPDGIRLCHRLGFQVLWVAEHGREEFSELRLGGR